MLWSRSSIDEGDATGAHEVASFLDLNFWISRSCCPSGSVSICCAFRIRDDPRAPRRAKIKNLMKEEENGFFLPVGSLHMLHQKYGN